jgi:phage terminase small subunit
MTSLNTRRERFARSIAAGKTNHQAAIEAGYSPHSAGCFGAQLVRFRSVSERVRQLRESRRRAEQFGQVIKARLDIPEEIEGTTLFGTEGSAIGVFFPVPRGRDQTPR